MSTISIMTELFEKEKYDQAFDIFQAEIERLEKLPYSKFKAELNEFKSAEDFKALILLAEYFLMYQYSAFLVRLAYKRFPDLLSTTWYCEDLLDRGKRLDADQLITAAIENCTENITDSPTVERAYFCKILCLLDIGRNNEAEGWIEKIKQSPRFQADRLGYIHLRKGDRYTAEKILLSGINHPEVNRFCYLLLSEQKVSDGHHEDALKLIEQGEKRFSGAPGILLEKIKRLRDLGRFEEMFEAITQLNKQTPKHVFRSYFRHLMNRTNYNQGKFDLLDKSDPLFANMQEEGELIKLSVKPIRQKHNYCVPASLAMILTSYGENLTQDEIASHIFDQTGSKLSTTVDYLEKNGFMCRYFQGTKENYQTLLKHNIPILLSVDFERASHVQILVGYDSRFELYQIQEPNLLETMLIPCEELLKGNAPTSNLSIAILPKNSKINLSFLNPVEDEYFRTLYSFSDQMDTDYQATKEGFIEFLKSQRNLPFTHIYAVKNFSTPEYSEFVLECAEKLLAEFPDHDYMNLHASHSLFKLGEVERAEIQLEQTKRKTFSSFYHYIKGRIAIYYDRYEEAVASLRHSLQLDPESYPAWSYLAMSYKELENWQAAKEAYQICTELYPDEIYEYMDLAEAIYQSESLENAVQFLRNLTNRFKEESVFFVNGGRLMADWAKEHEDQDLLEEAVGLFETGIPLIENNLREALEIFVRMVEDTPFIDRALAFLGRMADEHPAITDFLCYQGTLFENKELYLDAMDCYHRALERSEDYLPYFRIGEVYYQHGSYQRAEEAFKNCLELDSEVNVACKRLADLAEYNGKTEEQIDYLFRLLELRPYDVNIEYLASLLDEEGLLSLLDRIDRLEDYSELWRLDSQSYVYEVLGNSEEGAAKLAQALKQAPNLPVLQHHRVKLFIKTGQWSLAYDWLKDLITQDSQNEELYPTLIELVDMANDWDQLHRFLERLEMEKGERISVYLSAADAIEQLIRNQGWDLQEDNRLLYKFAGMIKRQSKQRMIKRIVIGLYEAAIRLDREDTYLVIRLSRFYENFGLTKEAVKLLSKALKFKWNFDFACELGYIYNSMKDYHAARPYFEACLREDPENTNLLSVIAYIIGETGGIDEAIERMLIVIKKNPFEKNSYSNLGKWLIHQDRYDEALEVLEEGRKYHPFDKFHLMMLNSAYFFFENYLKALEDINLALSIDESHLGARYYKANTLCMLGRTNEALSELDYIFEHDASGKFRKLAEEDEDLKKLLMVRT